MNKINRKILPDYEKIPNLFKMEDFLIRPLRVTDVELDYKAVIANREMLLLVSDGLWPTDKFTLEKDREDLIQHQHAHDQGEDFTFTIMNLDESECLGCIYIQPLKPRLERFLKENDPILKRIDQYSVRVHFWLVPKIVKAGQAKLFLINLINWLKKSWSFKQIAFMIESFNNQLYDNEIVKENFEFLCSERTDTRINTFYLLIM